MCYANCCKPHAHYSQRIMVMALRPWSKKLKRLKKVNYRVALIIYMMHDARRQDWS